MITALTTPIKDAYGDTYPSLLEYFEREAATRDVGASLRQAIATRDYLRKLIESNDADPKHSSILDYAKPLATDANTVTTETGERIPASVALELQRLRQENADLKAERNNYDLLKATNMQAAYGIEQLDFATHACTDNAPRNEIAWLIGWLNCELAHKDDDPGRGVVERIDTVDAWLKS